MKNHKIRTNPLVVCWLLIGCLLFQPVWLFAYSVFDNPKKKEEVSKTISEKYSVDKDTKLRVLNRYGKVHVNTSAKNEITMEVQIKAYGRNKEKAKEILDNITIQYSKAGNIISYETIIDANKKESWWPNWDWSWGDSDDKGFEINYTINMPAENNLELENKYGNVFLDNFSGVLNLTVKYGNLKANSLRGSGKNVELAYSKGSIELLEQGNLICKYGSANVEEVGEIGLENKYSTCKINKAKKIQTETKYGGLEVNKIDFLHGVIAYSNCEIGELGKKMNVEVRYAGKFEIEKVAAGFESIDIEGSYNAVKLGFESKAAFDYSIETKYGGFKSSLTNTNVTKQIEDNNSEYYEGSVNGGKNGKVKISLRYGGVKFWVN